MDTFYILLGRPWLFDHRVMHDGYQKTCTLLESSQKTTLVLLAPYQISKPKTKEEPRGDDMLLSLLESTLLATHHQYKTLKEMILFTLHKKKLKPYFTF